MRRGAAGFSGWIEIFNNYLYSKKKGDMGQKATRSVVSTSGGYPGTGEELLVGVGNDILVVDDDRVVLDYIKTHLADEGYNIILAENGVQAIKHLKNSVFNLLLVDKNLPDINGLALIKMCREMSPDTETILITAYATLDSAIEAIGLGAYDYILKPFDPSVLRDKVRKAMEHQKVKYENKVLLDFLKKANEDLEVSKTMLEKQVQERTAELKKVNEDLKKLGKIQGDILATVLQEMRALRERILSCSREDGSKISESLREEGERLSRIISEVEELSRLEVIDMS